MPVQRHNEEQLRQYASQLEHIPPDQVRQLEAYLPLGESHDYLAGVILGLSIALAPDATDRLTLQKMLPVLANRVVSG